MKEIGNADRQQVGRRLNNRGENSHQPFDGENELCSGSEAGIELQKFSSIRAQVHNHFNRYRHLVTRADHKQRHSVALAEWRTVIA
jgi:putative transposase